MESSGRMISSFPLTTTQKQKLLVAGLLTVSDIWSFKPSVLAKELQISNSEALSILKVIKPRDDDSKKARSALDMLREEEQLTKIVTFCERLDEMLGGGVCLGQITEFCGAPGVGKTQIGMQLSVDAQLPQSLGGVCGQVVYIDTEGSFIVERLAEIASNTITHCHRISQQSHIDEMSTLQNFSMESILSGIHYYRCRDYVELLATVHLLPDFIKSHPQVRLVVVDSIAFHFRHDFTDLSLRTRLLTGLAQSFIRLATTHKIADFPPKTNGTLLAVDNDCHLVGWRRVYHVETSLIESSTVMVVLYWEGVARLYKSPTHGWTDTVPFQITTAGIRDIISTPCATTTRNTTDSSLDSHSEPPNKRYKPNTST